MPDKNEMRLQVFLAHTGLASRRTSEAIISAGRVSVNGKIVSALGTKVFNDDEVCVDGVRIFLEKKKRYVLLHKPEGFVSSSSDEKQRRCAYDLLKNSFPERLYNVGRLDMYSSGLLVFTNDGDFAKKISHPSSELEKEYFVETSTALPRNLAGDFEKGVRIENVFYKAKSARELNTHEMRIVLIEGKNREIRTVFSHYHTGIKRLSRVRIGNILIGDLKEGGFRELSEKEVRELLLLCKNENR